MARKRPAYKNLPILLPKMARNSEPEDPIRVVSPPHEPSAGQKVVSCFQQNESKKQAFCKAVEKGFLKEEEKKEESRRKKAKIFLRKNAGDV